MRSPRHSVPVPIAIIGRSHASEFRMLVRQIQNSADLNIVGQFEAIQDSLDAGLGEQLAADVVVVLQAFSDEYSSADASQLIGRMLFARVLCCYGPWCLSDGRTHEVWPVAARVSVASAWTILDQEVHNIRAGRLALLPMAAAEEVFFHRGTMESDQYPNAYDAILIVSDDRVLRETIAEILRHAANQVFIEGTSDNEVQRGLKKLNAANSASSKVSVLLDIDGMETHETRLLAAIRSQVPACRLVRLTSFPQAVPAQGVYEQIVDKLELNAQLVFPRTS